MYLFHPLTGNGYQFWSGIGSDFSEVTILAGLAGLYYKHNCHVKKCPRIGKHIIKGSPYCTKHLEGVRNGKVNS